jgi:hypothetical protein
MMQEPQDNNWEGFAVRRIAGQTDFENRDERAGATTFQGAAIGAQCSGACCRLRRPAADFLFIHGGFAG